MRPEDRENQRYAAQEFCQISREEEIMFELLAAGHPHVPEKSLSVLDLGCGSGRITEELARRGYRVKGLDFSETAVASARAKGLDVERADLDEGIPEADGAYDVVWAGDVVEHVFDPIGLLRESARVLRSGGIMLITIPSDVGLVSRVKMLFGISHQEQMYYSSGFYKHHTFFTPRLIRFMLKKAHLDPEVFKRVLILGTRRYQVPALPSAFFNEMIIRARKR